MTAEGYIEGELFLGKVAAKQNKSGLVIKLRRQGRGADDDHIRLVGMVTRDGRPVPFGRVGAWWQQARRRRKLSPGREPSRRWSAAERRPRACSSTSVLPAGSSSGDAASFSA